MSMERLFNDILPALKSGVSLQRRMTYQRSIHLRSKLRSVLECCYKYNVSEEGRRSYKLAQALRNAMFNGYAGKLVDFGKLEQNDLIRLFDETEEEINRRNAPNDNKSYC